MSPRWGIWVEEYQYGAEGLQRFWLQDGAGRKLTYDTAAEAADACREWFGQVPEHMTVREFWSNDNQDPNRW